MKIMISSKNAIYFKLSEYFKSRRNGQKGCNMKYVAIFLAVLPACNTSNSFKCAQKGDRIDSLDGVYVYDNGNMYNVSGRNMTADGYNLGLKYQCVEFVKRYYYEHYHHKMPNSYGNAKDFFNPSCSDGSYNPDRALLQFKNGSNTLPKKGDLVVFSGTLFNAYGHVAILSNYKKNNVEIIQQNCFTSRETYQLSKTANKYTINESGILGWLRIKE